MRDLTTAGVADRGEAQAYARATADEPRSISPEVGEDPGAARRTMRYGVAMALRIPAVLAFTLVGATAAGVAAVSCHGTGAPPPDAMLCSVPCIPSGVGSNGCTPPTCATGPNHDVCPVGCKPDPIA